MLFAYGDVYMKQMSTCLLRQRIYIYIYIYIYQSSIVNIVQYQPI